MNIREFFEGKEKLIPGFYAVNDPLDGILKFYKISIPKKGKWLGYIFVSVQASSDFYPIKNREHREAIINEILKNPLECMKRYGREIGSCAICGRTLTDDLSRDRGIGPICWNYINKGNDDD